MSELMTLFLELGTKYNTIVQEPLLYDAAIHMVEHLGHRVFWPQPLPAPEQYRRRSIINLVLSGMLRASDER
jgi:hypothetical protein